MFVYIEVDYNEELEREKTRLQKIFFYSKHKNNTRIIIWCSMQSSAYLLLYTLLSKFNWIIQAVAIPSCTKKKNIYQYVKDAQYITSDMFT